MPANVKFYWDPSRFNARLFAAVKPARQDWARIARSRAPSRRVSASVRVVNERVVAIPLGGLLEKGAPRHEIAPKGRVLRLADGRFVSGPVEHPGMRARPWLRPMLPMWPEMYRNRVRASMVGFRR